MLNYRQISIGSVMGLMAFVAAILIKNNLVTLLSIECVAIYFCVSVLNRNLPRGIRRRQHANCKRANGSWSDRRAAIERRGTQKVQRNVAYTFLAVAIVSNLALFVINVEVFPLSVGISAIQKFRPSGADWKANLGPDEQHLEHWGKSQHMSASQVDTRKRFMWHSWPLMITVGLAWALGCLSFIRASHMHALRELSASVDHRAEQYRYQDLRLGSLPTQQDRIARKRSSEKKLSQW